MSQWCHYGDDFEASMNAIQNEALRVGVRLNAAETDKELTWEGIVQIHSQYLCHLLTQKSDIRRDLQGQRLQTSLRLFLTSL